MVAATSGNTGASVAMISAMKGYHYIGEYSPTPGASLQVHLAEDAAGCACGRACQRCQSGNVVAASVQQRGRLLGVLREHSSSDVLPGLDTAICCRSLCHKCPSVGLPALPCTHQR